MRYAFLMIWLLNSGVLQAQAPVKFGGTTAPGFSTERLSAGQFKLLHAAVAPNGPAERWAEIPWQTDLAAARQIAARENKPLFMWVMDGHPLGCT